MQHWGTVGLGGNCHVLQDRIHACISGPYVAKMIQDGCPEVHRAAREIV